MIRGALGGNTKTVKAYGKRKTHTVNRVEPNWAVDSDDSDTAAALPRPVIPAATAAVAAKSRINQPVQKKPIVLSSQAVSSDSDDHQDDARYVPTKAVDRRRLALQEIKARRASTKSKQNNNKENLAASGNDDDSDDEVHVAASGVPKSGRTGKAKRKTVVSMIIASSPESSPPHAIQSKSKGKAIIREGEETESEECDEEVAVTAYDSSCSSRNDQPITNGEKEIDSTRRKGRTDVLIASISQPRRTTKSVSSLTTTSLNNLGLRRSLPVPAMKRRGTPVKDSAAANDLADLVIQLRQVSMEKAPSNIIDLTESPVSAPHSTRSKKQQQLSPVSSSAAIVHPPSTILLQARASPLISIHELPTCLSPLLAASSCPQALDFSSFVSNAPLPFALSDSWRKIGEASYSEVYSAKDVDGSEMVIKIIPVLSPDVVSAFDCRSSSSSEMVEEEQDMPYSSEWESVLREIEISRLVGGVESMSGFVGFKSSFIVQGDYPIPLLESWDAFKNAQRPMCEDQVRPDVLPSNQLYALICLSHGGSDLESYKLRTWHEAISVLWQVANICSRAEKDSEFEHRDLHWGNVLLKPVDRSLLSDPATQLMTTPSRNTARMKSGLTSLESSNSSIEVTLIDFTLSRAKLDDRRIVFDPFSDDCIFEGEGDEQFDVYRSMREHVGSDWKGFYPLTNVMWLHYLIVKLLRSKKIKIPPASSAALSSFPSITLSPSRPHTIRSSPSKNRLIPASARRARTMPSRRGLLEQAKEREERVWYEMMVGLEERVSLALEMNTGSKKKGRAVPSKSKSKKTNTVSIDEIQSATSFVELWEKQISCA